MEHIGRETLPAEERSGDAPFGGLLLTTKLNVPSTRTNLVTRPRLTERLDRGINNKLTLVCAPAGFGKSTLLGEWVLRSELPVGWLSLDDEDNDPTRFLSYLVAALQTVEAGVMEKALSMLRSPQPPTLAVLTALVNEVAVLPKDFALILDDYHVIGNEAVHGALAFLLQHLPPRMHLIVASRTDPPLPLTRLLAGGNLVKITASDLRFTPGETAEFLDEVMGLDLSAENIAALEERTEGWIAGLQLAALSMQGREDVSGFVSAFAGTNRHVFDYLAEEVLDRQPEDTRRFLLRTSILDRLSGPLCDAVTRQGDGRSRLEELERMNLLMVPLDDRRRWYRYHHLFSDFLRERLRRDHPEMVSELHRRASVWHEANGTPSEAVGHALAAEDFERAADLIERLLDMIYGRGESPALVRLLRALPDEVLRSRPHLEILYAVFVLCDSGRFDAAEARLRDVERMLGLDSEGPIEAIEDERLANYAGEVAAARAFIAGVRTADMRKSIAFGRRALELLAEDNLGFRNFAAINLAYDYLVSGDLETASRAIGEVIEISRAAGFPAQICLSLILLSQLQAIRGRLSEAAGTCERVLRFAAEHAETVSLVEGGQAHVGMGELLFEWNDLEAATRHLLEGVELMLEWSGLGETTSRLLEGTEAYERAGGPEEVLVDFDAAESVVTGYISLARIKQAQGDTEGAFEALRQGDRIAQDPHIGPQWKLRVEAWRARLRIAQCDLKAADRWARERRLSAEDELEYSPESELEYVTLARLFIAHDRHAQAAILIERLLEAAEAGGRGRTVIELLVLKALALQGDQPAALDALRRALTLAEPEGYVRTFADEGAPMADLLRRLLKAQRREQPSGAEDGVSPEYVGRLLEALVAGLTTPAKVRIRGSAELVLDPITGRELEVLKLLDSELSNREIAGRLFVSLDTVKSHTRHIYAKLGVRARHQAVARARELKLLPEK